MSVILLDLEHYKEVFKKACTYEWRRVVDINYCSALSLSQSRLRDWLLSLYTMNVYSQHGAFDESDIILIEEAEAAIAKWNPDKMEGQPCNTYQMLKFLECIHYQIEPGTMDNKRLEWNCQDLILLENAIDQLKNRIIETIPEYNDAKWAIW